MKCPTSHVFQGEQSSLGADSQSEVAEREAYVRSLEEDLRAKDQALVMAEARILALQCQPYSTAAAHAPLVMEHKCPSSPPQALPTALDTSVSTSKASFKSAVSSSSFTTGLLEDLKRRRERRLEALREFL